MKKQLILMMWLFLLLGLQACGNEDEEFESIELQTTGVTLSPLSHNVFSYYGEIGYAGGEITFTAIGKNAESGYLSQFKVGDYLYQVTDADLKRQAPYTICEEEWGKIDVISTSPHITRLVLNENQTNNSINYELTFGGAYKISYVLLTQLKDK